LQDRRVEAIFQGDIRSGSRSLSCRRPLDGHRVQQDERRRAGSRR
jgi:hypothetical protein